MPGGATPLTVITTFKGTAWRRTHETNRGVVARSRVRRANVMPGPGRVKRRPHALIGTYGCKSGPGFARKGTRHFEKANRGEARAEAALDHASFSNLTELSRRRDA